MTIYHPAHPHYAVHKAYIEGCFANPDNPPVVECRDQEDDSWESILSPCWDTNTQYRIKPRTITRTVTYPEPLRKEPERGTTVYPVVSSCEASISYNWISSSGQIQTLKNGMCFATEADAQACYDALFGGQK